LPRFRLAQLPELLRSGVRYSSTKATPSTGPSKGYAIPEGHGEQIWVYTHRKSEQIIYSFENRLNPHHDMKQIPFNGKKLKAANLRKDYWFPMASIEFPPGKGSVGRSVYQKLRELKHLHEVSWSDEIRYKRPEEYTGKEKAAAKKALENGHEFKALRSRVERGHALNAQKPFSIADMAAVLSGAGRGNKIVTEGNALLDVTVRWANDEDKMNAEEWSSNVTHGLLENPTYITNPKLAVEPMPVQTEPTPATAAATEAV
jgi:hypothetical protein